MDIVFCVLSAFLLIDLFMILVCSLKGLHKVYCWIFEHKKWKLWEKILKNIDDALLIEHAKFEDQPDIENYKFRERVGDDEYVLILWMRSGTVSVHSKEKRECILSHFDTYHSKKAAAKLASKVLIIESVQEQLYGDKGEW